MIAGIDADELKRRLQADEVMFHESLDFRGRRIGVGARWKEQRRAFLLRDGKAPGSPIDQNSYESSKSC